MASLKLTKEQVNELRERSKLDHAIIVGSEVRQLCDLADELFGLKKYVAYCSAILPGDGLLAVKIDRLKDELRDL